VRSQRAARMMPSTIAFRVRSTAHAAVPFRATGLLAYRDSVVAHGAEDKRSDVRRPLIRRVRYRAVRLRTRVKAPPVRYEQRYAQNGAAIKER